MLDHGPETKTLLFEARTKIRGCAHEKDYASEALTDRSSSCKGSLVTAQESGAMTC